MVKDEIRDRMIERLKDYFKSELLELGYFKNPDGRQLYEMSLEELQQTYETLKHRKMSDVDGKQ